MKTTLRSRELTCPSCIVKIEKSLKTIKGVKKAEVFFNSGRIVIEHDETAVPEEFIQAVSDVGYKADLSSI